MNPSWFPLVPCIFCFLYQREFLVYYLEPDYDTRIRHGYGVQKPFGRTSSAMKPIRPGAIRRSDSSRPGWRVTDVLRYYPVQKRRSKDASVRWFLLGVHGRHVCTICTSAGPATRTGPSCGRRRSTAPAFVRFHLGTCPALQARDRVAPQLGPRQTQRQPSLDLDRPGGNVGRR
jgi:hypothetical protein